MRWRLITVDPGHFHAALFQKERLPGVADTVHVYAPLGPDLVAHLNRISLFNHRSENPTAWQLEVHAGADYWTRLLAERPGNVAVFSGNNRGKISRIDALAAQGLHVLADKPWIIEAEDLPLLQQALDRAQQAGVIVMDAMTQRFEVTCQLQKELVNDREIFGECQKGSPAEPAVFMDSLHYLLKEVAGKPNLRPAWFFDVRQEGEGLADVGTHLVDLVQWTLFPEQQLDWQKEIQVLDGARQPVSISREQFRRVTGEADFPAFLRDSLHGDKLEYYCHNTVHYTLRGIHIGLVVRWDFESRDGSLDTELAIYRGTRSTVEVRQGKEENYQGEVYVVPANQADLNRFADLLARKVKALQAQYPGVQLEQQPGRFRLVIPPALRIGHEAHFVLLTRQFLNYLQHPKSFPAWENPNLVAKYSVTTRGVAMARQKRQ